MRDYRRNRAEQLGLFGDPQAAPTPRRLPTIDRTDSRDAWIFGREEEFSHGCDTSGDEKAAGRIAQNQAWLAGFRPTTAPYPYNPEPIGHPARDYKEPKGKVAAPKRFKVGKAAASELEMRREVAEPSDPWYELLMAWDGKGVVAESDTSSTLADQATALANDLDYMVESGELPKDEAKHSKSAIGSLTTLSGKLAAWHVPIVWADVPRPDLDFDPNVLAYDKIIIMYSGGKDSVACLLYVIELLVAAGRNPGEVVECWHRCVDGNPHPVDTSGRPVPKHYVWDWPSTEDYLVQTCNHLGIPLLLQWREGGITEGVFLRKGDPPSTCAWEDPGTGPVYTHREGTAPPPGYRVVRNSGRDWDRDVPGMKAGVPRDSHRLMWPKIGGIHKGRYCSAYVKIEVAGMASVNQARLDQARVLIITGERAEESTNRATYKKRSFGPGHGARPVRNGKKAEVGRHVEEWKPVLDWCEIEVWGIMARHGINPHPAYMLGWGRLSCLVCVFASTSQFETIRSTSAYGAERFGQLQRAEAALCRIQAEEKRYPARWNKDDFKLAIPTIKYDSVTVDGKRIQQPVPLGEYANTPVSEGRRVDPSVVQSELAKAGVPQDVIDYHVSRAAAGLPVAYFPAITQPDLVLAAMSPHLPVAGAPRPDGGTWSWTWSPIEPRWADPSWLPAGAFGEDAGPT